MFKKFSTVAAIASLGYVSWLGGKESERRKVLKEKDLLDTWGSRLGLGSFRVSAATPFKSSPTIITQDNLGLTTTNSPYSVRVFDDFMLVYDTRNRIPFLTFEHLTKDNIKRVGEVTRQRSEFTEDSEIHEYFRSKNSDYFKSGYDRGHLAAAGNHMKSQTHCNQTFTLSNIAPQVGVGFNRNSWNRLEKYTRHLARKYPNVYVCTGPLFIEKRVDGKKYVKYEVIGESNVAVPTHFFKVILVEKDDGTYSLLPFIMPNAPIDDNKKLDEFITTLEKIQKRSGIMIFDEISKSGKLKEKSNRLI
ncbi:nuclease C1-like [Cimex lectularius]|uniref:Endonuclease n=1 Tax=Cimex lectularius TaxID=79782 RepID=A0A8I6RCQ9_CIMLE|nr:nuclease C1-like [Cimex lectularius]